jgi:hypothetical protein
MGSKPKKPLASARVKSESGDSARTSDSRITHMSITADRVMDGVMNSFQASSSAADIFICGANGVVVTKEVPVS